LIELPYRSTILATNKQPAASSQRARFILLTAECRLQPKATQRSA
jgi:hypothetical protein